MELYQAEYMVGGTGTVAIESDSDLTCELGSFSYARRFSDMEQSSEKTSELCSQVDCRSGQDGVKGQDERQRTAPLTPSRPPQEFCVLTEADDVIHGSYGEKLAKNGALDTAPASTGEPLSRIS